MTAAHSPRPAHALNYWLLGFLMFANVFDMGGGFGLKYLSYVAVLAGMFLQVPVNRLVVWELLLFFVILIAVPSLSLLVGLSNGGDLRVGIGQITPFFPAFLLLLFLRSEHAWTAWHYWYSAMKLLALLIIVFFLVMVVFSRSAILSVLVDILNSTGQGYFGAREIGPISIPNVYFKATLFIVPAFAYALFSGHKVSALILAGGLAMSFSKAAFVFCMLLLFLAWIRNLSRARLSAVQTIGIGVLGFVLYWAATDILVGYMSLVIDTLSGRSETASVRLGHATSVLSLFASNPVYMLIGQGVGTEFYSEGASAFVTDIELDHLDAIRQFGLPWFIAFTLLFASICASLIARQGKGDGAAAIALISLYIVAGSNPVLINPLTLILLVVLWRASESSVQKPVDEPSSPAPIALPG